MTAADINAKFARQAKALRPWLAKAGERTGVKMEDAAAHAAKAVTEALKRTPDGRATIRRAGQSLSYSAALARLDELWEWLCGPSAASLEGFLRDARESFYADAFRAWIGHIPEDLRVSTDPTPTQANLRAIRGLAIHGMDVRTEVGGAIDRAKRSLKAAIVLAGRQAIASRESDRIVRAWRMKAENAIGQVVATALSDGQIAADRQAGRDMIHPDYLIPLEG